VQNSPFQVNERSHVSPVREPLMFQSSEFSTLLRVRIELIFQRNTAYLSGLYLQCEEHYFVQNSHFQVNGRSTVCLVKEQLMLQARGPRTLFGIVNSVSWLKDYGLALSVSMGEECHLFAKSPHSNEWKKQCSSCKRIIKYSLFSRALKCEEHRLCDKQLNSTQWNNHSMS
jgi:hypothetical protein